MCTEVTDNIICQGVSARQRVRVPCPPPPALSLPEVLCVRALPEPSPILLCKEIRDDNKIQET